MEKELMYKYWGKARKKENSEEYDYHLLVHHCLDVAAVGRILFENDSFLKNRLLSLIGLNEDTLISFLQFLHLIFRNL